MFIYSYLISFTKLFGFFLIYAQWNSPSPCRCHVQVVKFHPSFSHPLDNYVVLKFSKVYSYSMVFFSKWAVCLVTCFDVVCNCRVISALPLLLNATTFYTRQPPSKIVYLTYMTYLFLWMTFETGLSSFFCCWEISFLVAVPSFLLLCRFLLLLNVLYVKLVWHILLFCELRGSAYGWVFFGLWK